ncbi:MAG TPA: PIN domain-containing protein [Caulobacter sp.]|nr:PIN domain-containing protein [Caulobacter sp.]
MIHLDTNVVIWVATTQRERLSTLALQALSREPPTVSPIVVLELQLLHDVGRIPLHPEAVLERLRSETGMAISLTGFERIISAARPLSWTRDPFDRLVCGASIADGAGLITADRHIRQHLPNAIW